MLNMQLQFFGGRGSKSGNTASNFEHRATASFYNGNKTIKARVRRY